MEVMRRTMAVSIHKMIDGEKGGETNEISDACYDGSSQ